MSQDNDQRYDLRLTGDQFNRVLQDAIQTSVTQTVRDIHTGLKDGERKFLATYSTISEEEKNAYLSISELRREQLESAVALTMVNFVEHFVAGLRGVASVPGTGEVLAAAHAEATARPEPSWKRLHEMIGFKP